MSSRCSFTWPNLQTSIHQCVVTAPIALHLWCAQMDKWWEPLHCKPSDIRGTVLSLSRANSCHRQIWISSIEIGFTLAQHGSRFLWYAERYTVLTMGYRHTRTNGVPIRALFVDAINENNSLVNVCQYCTRCSEIRLNSGQLIHSFQTAHPSCKRSVSIILPVFCLICTSLSGIITASVWHISFVTWQNFSRGDRVRSDRCSSSSPWVRVHAF